MKIRTEADIEKLDAKIKQELGVEVSKYRNEEVAENFVELLIFPKYVIKWVILPVSISFMAYIAGFFLFNLVHIEYVIYGIIGLILFLLLGIISGLFFLMWRMKSDMWGIISYSLEIMKSAVTDLNQVNNQIDNENRKEVLGLLFKGIIHIVTIPVLSKAISTKVPFVGGIVNSIIKKVLTVVSNKIKFDEVKLKQELDKPENESNALKIYTNSISSATAGLEKVMNFTFGIVKLPLKIALIIICPIVLLFLYLIN